VRYTIIAAGVFAVFVAPVWLLAWSLCRAAAQADRDLEQWT
jgi:hypothetical protein